jgi:DHA1 family tetracycline resistance protein-like MFS transporter
MSGHREPQKRKPSLGAIFLTVFLDLVGFGLVFPFLAEEARDSFGSTAFVGTLLSAVYSLMQFLFVPVWGRVSDRFGRRPVLVWSIAATVLSMTGLGLALAYGHSIAWLFAARMFSGIATANLGTASAYIADITSPADRAKGMGLIGMAFGLGFILGPALGGWFAQFPVNGRYGAVACFVAASLSAANFVWAAIGLPESLPPDRRGDGRQKRRLSPFDLTAARATFALPGVGLAIVVNFIAVLSFANLDQTFRYFNKDLFGMTQVETGFVLAFIGVMAAGVQGGLIRPLAKRMDETRLIRTGVTLQALAFAGLALSPTFGRPFLYAAGGLLAVGNGLTQPSVSAFISKRATSRDQGATLGTSQGFASLARMFGPALGGFLYGQFGPRSPYVLASVGMVVALSVAIGLRAQPTLGNTSTQMS